MNYWLIKTEPKSYSLEDLRVKKRDIWDGVRNFQARNYLDKMNLGDRIFVYHSGKQKSIVGMATVSKTAFPDPSADGSDGWLATEIAYYCHFPNTLSLKSIKSLPALENLLLIKQPRLSVMPVERHHADWLLNYLKDEKTELL
ncbi:EVE domain-containing protein [Pleomorphovibrio marinus]|uniref:EVE domain-containing protein n=1 Tax=Pleomorphovibrio marinus TaxID=2164132 RepID=UPI000E0BC311|nr:EVE domain-containing protein [Pleomorphovibrio marinus]